MSSVGASGASLSSGAGVSTTSLPAARQPTLIVTCRARPGHERELEEWLRRLVAAAAKASGCLDVELQPPGATHPREWVFLHRFSDPRSLAWWINSLDRQVLMAGGAAHLDGFAHEQVASLAPSRPPVTAVLTVPVRAEHRAAFRQLHDLSVERMAGMPGFLHAELLDPVPGVQDDTVILLTFDTRDHLDEWLASHDRKQLVERQSEYLLAPRTLNVVGGFAGWFESGRGDVTRWKSGAAVLLAIVPASQVYLAARTSLFPQLNVVVATVVGNVFTVAALTYVLMPVITRRLKHWLLGAGAA